MSKILLFDHIDEPGLNTLEVYQRRGGYEMLRKALTMAPEDVLAQISDSGVRGRGGAGFPTGRKISFLPHGDLEKYLVCNADESEPGTFKDRELMQKTPHMLIEGLVIAAYAGQISRAFIYVRGEYQLQADIIEAAMAEASAAGYVGDEHPREWFFPIPGAAPRRRRLHLRRGDRPAGLARGQARQSAPEAAVSRDRRAVRGADVDQQRRDPVDDPGDHANGGCAVRGARHEGLDRDQAGLDLR